MDETTRLLIIYGILPIILGLGAYFMRNLLQRITDLEKAVQSKVEETDVRQLLVDKIEPLRNDVQKLEIKLDKLIDMLLHK